MGGFKRGCDEDYEPTASPDVKRPMRELEQTNNGLATTLGEHTAGPIDPFFGQRRAFPISIAEEDVDTEKVPSCVEEYLAQVRALSRRCGVDYGEESGEDDELVYIAPARNDDKNSEADEDPNSFLADTVTRFCNLRNNYKTYRSTLTSLDAIDLPTTAKEWKKFIWETSCEDAYIAQIVEEGHGPLLLVYFTRWLSMTPDTNLLAWTWGILASFGPLDSSELALVRALGLKAAKQLRSAPQNAELRELCSVIAVEFRQRDLLTELL